MKSQLDQLLSSIPSRSNITQRSNLGMPNDGGLPGDSGNDQEQLFDNQTEEPDFYANLAEFIDDRVLDDMASEILQKLDGFEEDNHPWMERIATVREQMGLVDYDRDDEPFPGASSVVFPMITKAQVQFMARALPEIFPADPVNTVVLGKEDNVRTEQATRARDVMNYQVTFGDPDNKKDFKKALWWLPLTGSVFRHGFHDPILDKNIIRTVRVEDMITPYNTISLFDTPLFAHRIYEPHNKTLKLIRSKFYRDIYLPLPGDNVGNLTDDAAQDIRDDVDGKTKTAATKSNNHEFYDAYIDYDLPGFEEKDENGEETGIGLPFVITIDTESQKILRIQRNWDKEDELKLKQVDFSHYKFLEGPGFLGCGLSHVIGSLQEACTGALRAFADSLAFAMLPAGWKSKDAKFSGSEVFAPGHFQDVDMTTDDINKAIKIAQFPAPPVTTLTFIDMINSQAEAIISTQNIMTGDQNPVGAPVGTTLALIEQAQKVISAQHQGLHESFSEELRILYRLNYNFLPDDAIFYAPKTEITVRRADFDKKIMVIPTADPSIASFQQRMAINQALWGFYKEAPMYFKDGGYPIARKMLTDITSQNTVLDDYMLTLEEFLQQQQQQPPSPDQQKMEIEGQKVQIQGQKLQIDGEKLKIDGEKAAIEAKKLELEQMKEQFSQMVQKMGIDLESMQVKLKEKEVDADIALRDKEIDAKYGIETIRLGQLNEGTDNMAIEGIEKHGILQRLMGKILR